MSRKDIIIAFRCCMFTFLLVLVVLRLAPKADHSLLFREYRSVSHAFRRQKISIRIYGAQDARQKPQQQTPGSLTQEKDKATPANPTAQRYLPPTAKATTVNNVNSTTVPGSQSSALVSSVAPPINKGNSKLVHAAETPGLATRVASPQVPTTAPIRATVSGTHGVLNATQDSDILYVVKCCKKFQVRALELYRAWGNKVRNIVFSTDDVLQGVPEQLQRILPFRDPEAVAFTRRSPFPVFHAASCAVTLLNLARILKEEAYSGVRWLMISDDDTFVIRDNVPKYLDTLNASQPHYVVLSNEEPVAFVARNGPNAPAMTIGATAPGILYSRGLLEKLRRDSDILFTRMAVFALCRRSQMGDDVALGLLARLTYNLPIIARPDLRGYHWHSEETPTDKMPLTIHTEQQFAPGHVSEMSQLAAQYYPRE